MTLNLSLPAIPRDTAALLEILDTFRGCNAQVEDICHGIGRLSPMAVDDDGVSRGLVGAIPSTELGKGTVLAVYLHCGPVWTLNFERTTGDHTANLSLPVPHRLWRDHALVLAPIAGMAA
jgi:hypothetical protein